MQKDESPLPPPIPPRRKRCKTQPKRPTITYTLETKPERKHRPAPPLPPPTAPQRNRGRRKTPSPFNENSSPTNAKSLDSLEYGPNSHEESTRHSFVNLETEKSNRSRSTSPFPKAPEINKYPPLYFTFQDYQMVMEGSVRSKDELFKEKNITFIEENQNVFIEEQKSNFTLGQKEKFDEENDKYSKDQQQEYNEEQEGTFFKEQQSALVEEEKHNGVEEEEDDESIEQILKMNTESNAFPVRENLTSATENEELYLHISSANEPHMSKEEFESPFAPFMENISFSNAREEIYFRVTTTDRPFEKCLGDWNRSFDNEPKEFKDESESNLYMFEDYMDRSNKLNARPRLLFSEDFFSIPQDENSVSTERSTTRVRFLIESPSTSTPDYDLNDDGTTYEEFIQRQFESYEKSSVQLTEVTDEELEDLDKNLNNTYENETENNEISNFESETAEDENMSESIYGLTADQINDYSYSDWEEEIENVETHSITACIENESNTDIKTEENVELSQLQEIIDNNIEVKNEDCTIEESCEVELIINKSEETCDVEVKNEDTVIEKLHKKELIIDENEGACHVEIKNENIIVEESQEKESIIDKSEETYERRKVFLDSSFYNLSNENDMWQSCDDNRDDTLPDECCQPNLPEVSEPTKYFEESIGIEKQNEINVERDSKHIENLKEEIISTTIPEIASTVEKKPVPESVRRNSFLETMLRDNNFSQDSWDTGSINCEVIATHPKQDLSALSEQQSTRPLDVVTEVATETEAAPRNNSKIKLTESGSQPKVQSRINVSSSNNKSAGDVKCDVLNELLTTFSAIKLKPVNTSTCESVRSKDPNEQKTDITMPVEVKTDKSYQFRKTQNTLEIKNDDSLKKEENFNSSIINSNLNVLTTDENLNLPKVDPNLNSLKVEESSIASINKDTSAIINEASNTQRNDNDNKAQTPVVVNKDQFREAVSIIPGSVRNFVKYYEIHSEISSISKIRDNAFKKQKCELVRDKEKSKAYKKSGEKNKKIFKNSTSPKTGITTNANIIDESSRKIPSPLNSPNEIKKKSSMKTIAPSPRPERKKSVQFDSDCTVINPRKKEDKEKEEEGTFSSFIGGIRTRLKKKAPIKPDVKKTEQPKGLKLDQCRTESAAIICIQKSPEAKAMACTTKPGNIGFLPKTETLQNNQTIVFYCTV